MDATGIIIGLLITLLVYSYLLGDNPLYRLAVHLLVGVTAGFTTLVVIRQVLWPVIAQLLDNPADPTALLWLVPLLLAFLLLFKAVPRLAWIGNSTLAVLVGIGASVALVGTITGTLWPQIAAATQPSALGAIGAVLTALFTICTLFMFQWTGRHAQSPPIWQRTIWGIGQLVLTVTFAALFAGAVSSSLALLSYQLGQFLTLMP
ncbi:MAG: hypothetical protein KJ063_22025 [Anaerolineae bacterium]|nr:hypothetical protein [Anaerolineae bacterium]